MRRESRRKEFSAMFYWDLTPKSVNNWSNANWPDLSRLRIHLSLRNHLGLCLPPSWNIEKMRKRKPRNKQKRQSCKIANFWKIRIFSTANINAALHHAAPLWVSHLTLKWSRLSCFCFLLALPAAEDAPGLFILIHVFLPPFLGGTLYKTLQDIKQRLFTMSPGPNPCWRKLENSAGDQSLFKRGDLAVGGKCWPFGV